MQHHEQDTADALSLLIISDSDDRLKQLQGSLSGDKVEITGTQSHPEPVQAYCTNHDLAVVDVAPSDLAEVLRNLRSSPGHVNATVLVSVNRCSPEPRLAGVLAQYRAMPCTPVELLRLVRDRTEFTPRPRRKGLL